jgi:hypothetical protein
MQRKREVKMANTTVARPRTARQAHWRLVYWSRFSGSTLCRPSRMATPAVRYALPEGGLGGHGDDLVSPCGVEVGNGGAGKTADDDGLAGEAAEGGQEAAEELDGKGEGQGVECVDLETPEASPLASVGDEVLDGTADAGGDGLLADEGDGGTGLEEGLLLALGCGLLRRRDCNSGVRGLDHAQGGDDFLEHVVELQRRGWVSIEF